MLNAGGLRGSRGAMPIVGCRYGISDDPRCPTLPKAFRSAGSDGGDAGSIRVFFINNPNETGGIFEGRVNWRGGQAGPIERFQAQCFAQNSSLCVPLPAQASRLNFPVVGVASPRPVDGQDGEYHVQNIDADDALSLVSAEIARLEGSRGASYKELLKNAADKDSILRFVSPTDTLLRYLQKNRREANLRILANAANKTLIPGALPPSLQGLTLIREKTPAVVYDVLNEALFLAKFNTSATAATVQAWSNDAGGAFDVIRDDPIQLFVQLTTNAHLAAVGLALTQVRDELVESRWQVYQNFNATQRAHYEQELRNLQISINKAYADAERERDKFEKGLGFFGNVVSGISGAIAAYATGNWLAFTTIIADIGVNLLGMDKALRDDVGEIEALRKIYQEVVTDYNRFSHDIKNENERMVRAKDASLTALLDAAQAYQSSLKQSYHVFDDLFKLSLMSRVSGLANAERDYRINVNQLSVIFTRYPIDTPSLASIRFYPKSCSEGAPKITDELKTPKLLYCASSEPDGTRFTSLRLKQTHAVFPDLVLYRFAPGVSSRVMDLHGLINSDEAVWVVE
jgi:hypothetical protein